MCLERRERERERLLMCVDTSDVLVTGTEMMMRCWTNVVLASGTQMDGFWGILTRGKIWLFITFVFGTGGKQISLKCQLIKVEIF